MKYFISTKHSTYARKPISWLPTVCGFNKPYDTTELISIGIVAEDGRAYYAITDTFNISKVEHKTLLGIYNDLLNKEWYAKRNFPDLVMPYNKKTVKTLIKWHNKSSDEIWWDVVGFMNCSITQHPSGIGRHSKSDEESGTEIYAYHADWDWLLFSSIFDHLLPDLFPSYCISIKQIADEQKIKLVDYDFPFGNRETALDDAKWNKAIYDKLMK